MSFFTALLAWLVIAAVLIVGVVMAVNGSLWLMLFSIVAFIALFSKYGCATH